MITDRNQIRQTFINAWQNHLQKKPLTDLQQQIVTVIQLHPEYHDLFAEDHDNINKDFRTDNNPFLHLGLHLSLNEQVKMDRPHGIQALYQRLSNKLNDQHAAQHKMMDAMANILWEAQQSGVLPDETQYLEQLQKILR